MSRTKMTKLNTYLAIVSEYNNKRLEGQQKAATKKNRVHEEDDHSSNNMKLEYLQ